jgi:hypothetical protein
MQSEKTLIMTNKHLLEARKSEIILVIVSKI